ncbi:MAG: hypothetical protein ABIL58_18805, partial [Pseudomonadota bacterium]
DNQTMAALTTAGGSKIHMEDKAGSERILMHVPKQSSFIRVGAHNDPPAAEGGKKTNTTDWGVAEKTDGWLEIQAQSKIEFIFGEVTDSVLGLRVFFTGGWRNYVVLGCQTEMHVPSLLKFKNDEIEVTADNFEAYAGYLAWRQSREQFSGMSNRVAGAISRATITHGDDIGTWTEARAQDVKALGQRTQTAAASVRARDQEVSAQLNKMTTVGARLESVGESLNSAGTQITDAGLMVGNAGQRTSTAGTTLRDAGIAVQQAPVINQV